MSSDLINNDVTTEAILDALQDVITDIDRFMFDWLQRFNRTAQQPTPTDKPDEQLRRRIEELQAQQHQWESQRLAEQEQLEANANQLTDAWLRLEAEQRALLQTVNMTSQLTAAIDIDRQATGIASPKDRRLIDTECQSSDRQTNEQQQTLRAAKARVAMPRDVIAPDAAIRQFEILKNEVSSTRKQPAGRSS